jgi:guanosine-3',5'-bis(diphosphate) 3'-pyrophosphohydrolase
MYFKALKKALKGNKKIDVKNVERAYLFAEKAHKGQKRKTGEDYITHPVAVALKLLEIGADEESIIAGLLHDTVEDTEATLKDVEKEFGKQVATIIDSITKVSNINFFGSQEEAKTATIRKIFTGSIEDERAIFVKLADRGS